MARGKKVFGKCAICGKEENMSFEHLPPQSTGNKGRLELIDFVSLININQKKIGKILQNGVGYYSLCESCNSFTGSLYGNAYTYWVNQIDFLNKNENLEKGILKETPISFYPLRGLKQVVSMFLSLNGGIIEEDISKQFKEFLLEKENQNLPKNFHFYFYVVSPKTRYNKQVPFPMSYVLDIRNRFIYNFSEISWGSMGFILSKTEGVPEFERNLVDINFFKNYKYDEKENLEFTFPVFPVNPKGTTKF